MKRSWMLAMALAVAGGLSAPANATGTTAWGKITEITGGWTVPMFGVQTAAPAINPDACQYSAPYIIPPDAPAHDMFVSMLMTAYARGDLVELTVSGCSGWPIIIGIRVHPAS